MFSIKSNSINSVMISDRYSLNWQTYSDHLKSMMKDLMMNGDFADVTLITEDKKHIKAHMSVLSASSPVFQFMFSKEKSLNHMIYLRGINFYEMEAIMQFIYLGEATFYEERINEILSVAKSLEIKKLYNAEADTNDKVNVEMSPHIQSEDELKDQPDQNLSKGQEIKEEIVQRWYRCDECQQRYRSRQGLHYHKKSSHDSVKYACNQCDYKASHYDNLASHIKHSHEGCRPHELDCESSPSSYDHIQSEEELKDRPDHSSLNASPKIKKKGRFDCEQCNKTYNSRQGLHSHRNSSHAGLKYACNECDFQALRHYQLIGHIRNKHEGIKYACNQCEFKCDLKENVGKHIKEMH